MRDETNSVRALTEGEEGESTDRLSLLFVLRRAGWLLARVCINLCFTYECSCLFFTCHSLVFFFKLKTRYFGKKREGYFSLFFEEGFLREIRFLLLL